MKSALQQLAGRLIITIVNHPEFYPRIERRYFANDAGSMFIFNEDAEALRLEDVPGIAYDEGVLIGINHPHGIPHYGPGEALIDPFFESGERVA